MHYIVPLAVPSPEINTLRSESNHLAPSINTNVKQNLRVLRAEFENLLAVSFFIFTQLTFNCLFLATHTVHVGTIYIFANKFIS